MDKKSSLPLDIELTYFDLLSNVFGGVAFFILFLLAQGKLGEEIHFLLTEEINEVIFVLIAIPVVYAVGMLLHSISSLVLWIFKRDLLLDFFLSSCIGRCIYILFTSHLLIGQSVRVISEKKGNGISFRSFKEHLLNYLNHSGGYARYYARASLSEVVFRSSLIGIGVYWYSQGCLFCCFSKNLLILLIVMLSSFIQSIYYWRKFAKNKMRKYERKETE